MDKNKETGLIFACGRSISKHASIIPNLVDKYVSVGINRFPNKFCERYLKNVKSLPVDYWMFSDAPASDYIVPDYCNQKIVANVNTPSELKKFKDKGIEVDILFGSIRKVEPELDEKRNLLFTYGYGSTTLNAIGLLIHLGCKDIVIFGMDNDVNKQGQFQHFYDTNGGGSTKSLKDREDINMQLQEYKKYVNLYKAYKSSKIDLEVMDLEGLINPK